MEKIYFYLIVSIFTLYTSCTFYTDNEFALEAKDDIEEVEEVNTLSLPKKLGVKLTNTNNLNESTVKLDKETKKIEAEISTLLETF